MLTNLLKVTQSDGIVRTWNQAIWLQSHTFNPAPCSTLHTSSYLMPNLSIHLTNTNKSLIMFQVLSQVVDDKEKKKKKWKTWDLVHHPEKNRNLEIFPRAHWKGQWKFPQCAQGRYGPPPVFPWATRRGSLGKFYTPEPEFSRLFHRISGAANLPCRGSVLHLKNLLIVLFFSGLQA